MIVMELTVKRYSRAFPAPTTKYVGITITGQISRSDQSRTLPIGGKAVSPRLNCTILTAVYWTHAVRGGGFRIDGAGDSEPKPRPHDRRCVCRLLPTVRRLLRRVDGGGSDRHHAAQL